ncbi:indole-3-glycerol phosphate synthase TrpC [Desertivibrio insolitus]|uniref:indole-3-glycerol phosphate synthase TrpC n=1 Tax=Herbiconiux sp. SYSU D00978 TaxID=2812562 RepID=UPI001A970BC3|nr:indole-3-glycerol phosphate synthase TrpC [Herbiconiux sp. SYSU D00978]
MATDLLAELTAGAVADARERQESTPLAAVEAAALEAAPALDARAALAVPTVSVIAEVKRASPSRGSLAAIPDPAELAALYEQGGAAVVSVLTEQRRFKGSLDDLRAVKQRVSIPVLRKDFLVEPYQLFEARAAGADVVLLIVASLEQRALVELHELATQLGMTALVEAHSADEVSRAVDAGATVVGVNARDLTTFELDAGLFGRLAPGIPDGVVKVAESAVSTEADVAAYRAAGADAVLVGEALVTDGDPVSTLQRFLAV